MTDLFPADPDGHAALETPGPHGPGSASDIGGGAEPRLDAPVSPPAVDHTRALHAIFGLTSPPGRSETRAVDGGTSGDRSDGSDISWASARSPVDPIRSGGEQPSAIGLLDEPADAGAVGRAWDRPVDESATVTRPAGVPPSPVRRERTGQATARLFAGLIAALVVAAAVLTVILVRADNQASGSGYVEPTAAAYLDFPQSGIVSDVLVKPGDHVRAGEVLAEQGTTELQARLAADQATLYADQARALELGGGGSDAAAQVSALVSQANGQLAAAKARVSTSLAAAQSLVQTSKARQQQAQSTLSAAEANYAAALVSCNASGRTASSEPTDAECAQIKSTLATDTSAVDNAAQALSQAQLALQTAESASSQQVALANSAAALAATKQSTGTSVGSSSDIASVNAAVSRDIAAVATDQADVAGAAIVSPVDGVVGSIGAQAGDYATPDGVRTYVPPSSSGANDGFQLFSAPSSGSGGSSSDGLQPVVIVYSSTVRVTAQLSEHAVTKVRVGEHATVTLPALGNRSYAAVVSDINPTAVSKNGSVYYLVDLALATPTLSGAMPGMTANVSFSS